MDIKEKNFFEEIRHFISVIIFWVVTIIAAFEAGIIFEHYRMDNYAERFTKIELGFSDLVMKVAAHETILKGRSK